MQQCPNVNILKVNNLLSQKSKELTNIRIVQLTPESDIKSLLNISKFLLHQVVKWSRLRTSYTQCRNCQRPDHAASNCNMKYRCMKCPKDHEPGRCPRTEELKSAIDSDDVDQIRKVKEEVSCVNCGEKGHPANYKKCKVYRAYIDKIEARNAKSKENQKFKSRAYNNFAQRPGSPSQVQCIVSGWFWRGQTEQWLCIPAKWMQRIVRSGSADQINAFMPMYRGASSAQEKKIMLISFLFQLHSQCP